MFILRAVENEWSFTRCTRYMINQCGTQKQNLSPASGKGFKWNTFSNCSFNNKKIFFLSFFLYLLIYLSSSYFFSFYCKKVGGLKPPQPLPLRGPWKNFQPPTHPRNMQRWYNCFNSCEKIEHKIVQTTTIKQTFVHSEIFRPWIVRNQ